MSLTKIRNGAPTKRPARETNRISPAVTTTPNGLKSNGLPVVRATTVDKPCPGRELWAYRVACPAGHGVHLHRGGPPNADGHVRTAPCGTEYRIVVGQMLVVVQ